LQAPQIQNQQPQIHPQQQQTPNQPQQQQQQQQLQQQQQQPQQQQQQALNQQNVQPATNLPVPNTLLNNLQKINQQQVAPGQTQNQQPQNPTPFQNQQPQQQPQNLTVLQNQQQQQPSQSVTNQLPETRSLPQVHQHQQHQHQHQQQQPPSQLKPESTSHKQDPHQSQDTKLPQSSHSNSSANNLKSHSHQEKTESTVVSTTTHPCLNPNASRCFAMISEQMTRTEEMLKMANRTLAQKPKTNKQNVETRELQSNQNLASNSNKKVLPTNHNSENPVLPKTVPASSGMQINKTPTNANANSQVVSSNNNQMPPIVSSPMNASQMQQPSDQAGKTNSNVNNLPQAQNSTSTNLSRRRKREIQKMRDVPQKINGEMLLIFIHHHLGVCRLRVS
jgi:hypothetical protein